VSFFNQIKRNGVLNQEIKAQDAGGEDLPQQRGESEAGYGLGAEQSEEWLTGRPYLDME
jgi:hypothetical protein